MVIIGKDDLLRDLRALGIGRGDGLFVHTALGKVGHVIGGPRGLIEALIEAIGEDGLIGMPGFSGDAYDPTEKMDLELSPDDRSKVRSQVLGFDPQRSNVSQNGSVPEAFRSWPKVVRSPHPTSSVLLWGREAEDLAANHDPLGWPTGPETPWGMLRYRPSMKILLIGVGWNRCSALHAAETLAAHRRATTRNFKIAAGPDGDWVKAPDVADDLNRLFPLVGKAWEEEGGVRFGKVGNAECKVTSYGPLLTFASDWINLRNRRDGVMPV